MTCKTSGVMAEWTGVEIPIKMRIKLIQFQAFAVMCRVKLQQHALDAMITKVHSVSKVVQTTFFATQIQNLFGGTDDSNRCATHLAEEKFTMMTGTDNYMAALAVANIQVLKWKAEIAKARFRFDDASNLSAQELQRIQLSQPPETQCRRYSLN